MNYNTTTYILYLAITLFVVFFVGHTLFRNGRPFLVNTFTGNEMLADAVNKILLSGFYLINAGYTIFVLKVWENVNTLREMINVLSMKTGMIILTLGIMHVFNVLFLVTIGRNKKRTLNTNH